MRSPYDIVHDFEEALCEYTGAPYCVAVNSCTSAIFLSLAYLKHVYKLHLIYIPKYTYLSIPMACKHAQYDIEFSNIDWEGEYQLSPYPIWDCARWLRGDMYRHDQFMCLSFHPTKHLGISTHGGAVLTDKHDAYLWLKRARYDGRREGVSPKEDTIDFIGWRCFMMPPTAAEGLERLARLPKNNEPLPKSDYVDLSQMDIFK